MRIIAGEFRRRRLKSNPGQTTRPITDRAKESLFARLEHRLEGVNVADIFAGTGSFGLEALSRGAIGCTFFERDPIAVKLLRENVASLELDDCCLVWPTDIFRTSFKPKNVDGILPWSVVFFDPPYRMVPHIRPGDALFKALDRLAGSGSVADGGLLVLRSPSRTEYEMPKRWQPEEELDRNVAGMPRSMELRVFRLEGEPASNDESASNGEPAAEGEPAPEGEPSP